MSVGNLAYISAQLIAHGKEAKTPVAVIEWGTTEQQRTLTGTLDNIHDLVVSEEYINPSMVLVGEVVQMRDKIKWYEKQLSTVLQ